MKPIKQRLKAIRRLYSNISQHDTLDQVDKTKVCVVSNDGISKSKLNIHSDGDFIIGLNGQRFNKYT